MLHYAVVFFVIALIAAIRRALALAITFGQRTRFQKMLDDAIALQEAEM